ncbi:MAG: copper chaperone PCu(A)C [Phyllobacteriaceae bacterium]|nr:copper chaperone PCu(A)C [Phyllobacteriaceae bacterium]
MMAQAGAGFMVIANAGDADKLVSAKSGVSEIVELHTHIEENGMKAMRKVDFIDVPANGAVELKPGSFHVMFINLKERLQQGAMLDVTLVFEKAGEVSLKMPVMGPGAMHAG